MNAKDVIKTALGTADMIGMAYVNDLSDAELMRRPHPGCNHINWQLGHLIAGENQMIEMVAPGSMPPLPDGFTQKYTKETAASDDLSSFADKETLLTAYRAQRQATLTALEGLDEARLDEATGVDYAPTIGGMFLLQADHWLMHCGQWVVVRRELGHSAMF